MALKRPKHMGAKDIVHHLKTDFKAFSGASDDISLVVIKKR